jgi:diguanylate cyclase (GGDEF)-like protein
MADRAMYETKRSGKNHFVFAGDGAGKQQRQREKKIPEMEKNGRQDADKDFLNVAFSLLSHARDLNASLNVLLEQIGKKYGLKRVTVLEGQTETGEVTVTNHWEAMGTKQDDVNFCAYLPGLETAETGKFIWLEQTEDDNGTGCIKYELAGNRTGYMCVSGHLPQEQGQAAVISTFCELSRVVAVFVTLRNKLREDQREIQQLQNRDKLTGLYNLEAFRCRVMDAMAQIKKESVYALIHVDINNFSYVNENFGQAIGDNILREFAAMLLQGENVLEACRMYSDYFIILAKGSSRQYILNQVIEGNVRFESALKKKYPTSSMTLSAGISFIENPKEEFESMLESANMARKKSKEFHMGKPVVYEPSMRLKRDDEIQISGRFYGALQKGELEMFLQPKFLLGEGRIYGAEALARWRLPGGELLSPAKFIPPLENLGYIVDLDFYIFEQLLRAMKRWQDAGKEQLIISTNFSRRHFDNGGTQFLERLGQILERYQVNPHHIEIEVTESVIVENYESMKACLEELKRRGFRIAIDDFGTGYSSLSVLLEIPAHVIKIDKSFTDRIDLAEQRQFVSQMGQFIQSAKEEVIFEGIETKEQEDFLRSCGFRYGQGYLFDRPLPMEEFERKYC